MEIEEIEVDPPRSKEVRIKIICTSLCHSDITMWKLKPVSSSSSINLWGALNYDSLSSTID